LFYFCFIFSFHQINLTSIHFLAFSILYVVCGIPFGFFADKYSRKYLVIFGIVIWSAMTIWQAAAKTYAELVIARMGLGVGEVKPLN